MSLNEPAVTAAEPVAGNVQAVLDQLVAKGAPLSADSVSQALKEAGNTEIQVREEYARVPFAVAAPEGGCIFGVVTKEDVSVEIGGYIMDGGCLPAQ